MKKKITFYNKKKCALLKQIQQFRKKNEYLGMQNATSKRLGPAVPSSTTTLPIAATSTHCHTPQRRSSSLKF